MALQCGEHLHSHCHENLVSLFNDYCHDMYIWQHKTTIVLFFFSFFLYNFFITLLFSIYSLFCSFPFSCLFSFGGYCISKQIYRTQNKHFQEVWCHCSRINTITIQYACLPNSVVSNPDICMSIYPPLFLENLLSLVLNHYQEPTIRTEVSLGFSSVSASPILV